jgi:Cysteine-rich secretory protein family
MAGQEKKWGRFARLAVICCLGFSAIRLLAQQDKQAAYELFHSVNQARAQNGLPSLAWDSSLAEAAGQHSERMASLGNLSHQFPGELDLAARTSAAGAHFRKIAENVAVGPSVPALHAQWMKSPPHRANILDPELNAIGIAVVRAGNNLYATEDFSGRVEALSSSEIEQRVSDLLAQRGLVISGGQRQAARQACTMDSGSVGEPAPGFIMRWQGSDLTRLPDVLEKRIASRRYHSAAVGSCSAGSGQGFTSYRVAVLLY